MGIKEKIMCNTFRKMRARGTKREREKKKQWLPYFFHSYIIHFLQVIENICISLNIQYLLILLWICSFVFQAFPFFWPMYLIQTIPYSGLSSRNTWQKKLFLIPNLSWPALPRASHSNFCLQHLPLPVDLPSIREQQGKTASNKVGNRR